PGGRDLDRPRPALAQARRDPRPARARRRRPTVRDQRPALPEPGGARGGDRTTVPYPEGPGVGRRPARGRTPRRTGPLLRRGDGGLAVPVRRDRRRGRRVPAVRAPTRALSSTHRPQATAGLPPRRG